MLLQGFSVPLKNKDLLFTTLGFYLEPGQNRMLQLAFRNQIYEIMLTNDAFDRGKYPEHKEIIQFRYNPSDALPVALREEYADSEYLKEHSLSNMKGSGLIRADCKDLFFRLYFLPEDQMLLLEEK